MSEQSESERITYGSFEWLILDTLHRYHSAKDCPHKGNCLNLEQALERIKSGHIAELAKAFEHGRIAEAKVCEEAKRHDYKRELAKARESAPIRAKVERHEYERLKKLQVKGYEDYQEMLKSMPLTEEATLVFINGLSLWNLKSSGVFALRTYIEQLQSQQTKEEAK